ncbi:MAG: hypothetical protein RL622_548, partial [Actinomycetota bacterium]
SFRLNSSYIPTDHPVVQRGLKLGLTTYGSPTTSDQAQMSFTTLKIIITAVLITLGCYWAFKGQEGWTGLITRSITYLVGFAATTWIFKLTPDLQPVLETIRKKIKGK